MRGASEKRNKVKAKRNYGKLPVSAVPSSQCLCRRLRGTGDKRWAQAAPSLITQLSFEGAWPMTWVDALNGRAGNEPAIFFFPSFP